MFWHFTILFLQLFVWALLLCSEDRALITPKLWLSLLCPVALAKEIDPPSFNSSHSHMVRIADTRAFNTVIVLIPLHHRDRSHFHFCSAFSWFNLGRYLGRFRFTPFNNFSFFPAIFQRVLLICFRINTLLSLLHHRIQVVKTDCGDLRHSPN